MAEAEPSHLSRYQFAQKYLNETDNVLDVPCGSGYGTRLLSPHCKKVVGVDICQDAIAHANEFFKDDNNHFLVGDMENVKNIFPRNYLFDKIISFEGIEHIKYPEKFLDEITGLLKQDGTLIISTPRKPHGSPYHTIEYSLDEFRAILSARFEIKKMFGQVFTDIFDLSESSGDPDSYHRFNFIAHCAPLKTRF